MTTLIQTDTTIRLAVGKSSLGSLGIAATERGICMILFGDSSAEIREAVQSRFTEANIGAADDELREWLAAIASQVDSPQSNLDLPLDIRGTDFQCKVWGALRAIPCGSTSTYAEIATTIGDPKSVRAVAGACAANKLAMVIPCHRVIRTDGDLGGYRWGIERKRRLLEREKGNS